MKLNHSLRLLTFVALLALVASCNSDKRQYFTIETDFGDITVVLYDQTPLHRDNFAKLVNEGFYDDLLFHRVMEGFMIQGGDPDSRNAPAGQRLGMGGPGYQIPAEIGAPHLRGALAAARNNNPEKKSSGSQFYIVQGEIQSPQVLDATERQKGIKYNEAQRQIYLEQGGTPQLDMDYTVFGEVVDGMEVVDQIAAVQTDPANRPIRDVKMRIRPGK